MVVAVNKTNTKTCSLSNIGERIKGSDEDWFVSLYWKYVNYRVNAYFQDMQNNNSL